MSQTTGEFLATHDFSVDVPDYDYGTGYCDGKDTLVAIENFLIAHGNQSFTLKEMAEALGMKSGTCAKYLAKHPYAKEAHRNRQRVLSYTSVAPSLEPTTEGLLEEEAIARHKETLVDYWLSLERGEPGGKKVPQSWKLARHDRGVVRRLRR